MSSSSLFQAEDRTSTRILEVGTSGTEQEPSDLSVLLPLRGVESEPLFSTSPIEPACAGLT